MRTTREAIDALLRERTVAVIGVSRDSRGFANAVYRGLQERGYRVFPVNPHAEVVEKVSCYPNVRSLPEPAGAAIVVLPSNLTERAVEEVVEAGIRHVWIHQGTETAGAVELARRRGVNLVVRECPMMFLSPVTGPHRFHRWIRKIMHRLPVESV